MQIFFQPSRDGTDFKEQFNTFSVSSCTDFKKFLTESSTYIDKTLFIKDIVNSNEMILYFSRPRKWGKSLNISMLKYFFQYQVNQQDGSQKKNSENKILFIGGISENSFKKKVFQRLKISQEQIFQMHFGKYIVIHLNLAKISVSNTLKEVKKRLIIYFYDLFVKYSYLKLSSSEKYRTLYQQSYDELAQIKAREQINGQLGLANLMNKLCQCLYHYHNNKECIILIDEYDSIVNNMISSNADIKDCQYISKQLLSLLQNNQVEERFIFKTIATGVLNSIRNGDLSQANKIFCFHILHYRFSSHFGVTWDQIQKYFIEPLINKDKLKEKFSQCQEKLKKRIKKWYNGYKLLIGNKYQEVYNPFSIVQYLKECSQRNIIAQGKEYWSVETCNNIILTKFFDKCQKQYVLKIFQIFNTGQVIKEGQNELQVLQNQMQMQQYSVLWNEKSDSISQASMNRLMVDLGYLTFKNLDKQKKLSIPNKEIKNGINNFLRRWFKNRNLVSQTQINIENMIQYFSKMEGLINSTKNNTFCVNQFNFHSLLHAIYVFSNSSHVATTEKYSGFGVLDNLFLPRLDQKNQKKQTAIIHEYKFYTNPQQAKNRQAAQKSHVELALWQIILKNYIDIIGQKNQYYPFVKKVILRSVVIQKISNQSKQIKIIGDQVILKKDQCKKVNQFVNKIMEIKSELTEMNNEEITQTIKTEFSTKRASDFLKLLTTNNQKQVCIMIERTIKALKSKNNQIQAKNRREKYPQNTRGTKKK